jgi:hypothetical protein
MSKFNTPAAPAKGDTVNLAGGAAFTQSHKLELVSLLLTSFGEDKYYEKANARYVRLASLIAADPHFAARAILFARREYGMRSISHVGAGLLGQHASGKPWAVEFYRELVYRVDDMLEVTAFLHARKEKLSAAMKKGFAQAFDRFNGYQLGKYRAADKEVKLVDLVNLLHPVPKEHNMEALKALIKGELRAEGTWEMELTQAGQQGATDADKAALKAAVWKRLILERKLGYFALLRNLRNILQQAPDVLPQALEQLVDPAAIQKSLVLPFRYATAYREMMQLPGKEARAAAVALSKAADIACANVPKLEGETLVALDVSGSMHGKPAEIGALFAAVLVKALNADLMSFHEVGTMRQVDPGNSTLSLAESMRFDSGGTNFHDIFRTMGDRKYDRVIILSDMMAWMPQNGYCSLERGTAIPTAELANYRQRTGCDPAIWSFDLAGNGTLMFPEKRVRCMAGFSEKVFDVMSALENDPQALVHTVEGYWPKPKE